MLAKEPASAFFCRWAPCRNQLNLLLGVNTHHLGCGPLTPASRFFWYIPSPHPQSAIPPGKPHRRRTSASASARASSCCVTAGGAFARRASNASSTGAWPAEGHLGRLAGGVLYYLRITQHRNTHQKEKLMHRVSRSEERRVRKECRSRWSPDH